jgi:hypothetical protein
VAGFFLCGRMGGMDTKWLLLTIALACLTLVLLAFAMWSVVIIFFSEGRELAVWLLAIPLWIAVSISVLLTWRSYAARK